MLSVLALVLGEALLIFGLWLIYPPAAIIAAGSQLIALGLVREVSVKVSSKVSTR